MNNYTEKYKKEKKARKRLLGILDKWIKRCHDPSYRGYCNWGARGIEVYQPWIDNPELFITHVKTLKDDWYDLELELIDDDEDFCPDNVVFQVKGSFYDRENTKQGARPNSKFAILDGETVTYAEAARRLRKTPGMITFWSQGKSLNSKPEGLEFVR